MRIHQILEARRNPEVNKKSSALSELQKYAGQKDVFVSFTDDVGRESHYSVERRKFIQIPFAPIRKSVEHISGPKLGINPNIGYGTPVGIYSYPIDYVLQNKMNIEFGGDRPFIWVFRAKNLSNCLMIKEYTFEDLERDKRKIYNIFKEKPDDVANLYSVINMATKSSKFKHPSSIFWNITRILSAPNFLSSQNVIKWTKLLLKLGYDGAIDYGSGLIHDNEPTQAVFFGKDKIEVLELIRNINPQSPYNITDILRKNTATFKKMLRANKLSDEVVISAINENNITDVLPFLSTGVLKYVKDNIDTFMNLGMSLKHIGFTDEEIFELLTSDKRQMDGSFSIDRSNILSLMPVNEWKDILDRLPEQEKSILEIEIMKLRSDFIKHMDNPTEKAQLISVGEEGKNIKFIKNPTEKVQIRALSNNISAIKEITNPTEKAQLHAIKINPLVIDYIDKPTEKAQIEAIKANLSAYHYISPLYRTFAVTELYNKLKKEQNGIGRLHLSQDW